MQVRKRSQQSIDSLRFRIIMAYVSILHTIMLVIHRTTSKFEISKIYLKERKFTARISFGLMILPSIPIWKSWHYFSWNWHYTLLSIHRASHYTFWLLLQWRSLLNILGKGLRFLRFMQKQCILYYLYATVLLSTVNYSVEHDSFVQWYTGERSLVLHDECWRWLAW